MNHRTIAMWAAMTQLGGALGAQTFQRGNPKVPEVEREEIQKARKSAAPRPLSPRGPVPEAERARARVFKGARNSVVYIDSIAYVLRPNILNYDLAKLPAGSGTGFVWDDHGHVVTNYHVITVDDGRGNALGDANELQVTLADGKSYKAQVVGRSIIHDIAVLQVFAPLDQLRPIPIGSTRELEVGHAVLAIGNPFGLDHTLTTGVVSAMGRDIPTERGPIRGAIQTDAAINPGNSGGPLLDSAGRLVGMNTAITSTSGSSAGIGFAIPVETLNRVVPELIRKGRVQPPVMGFDSLPDPVATTLGVESGVVVYTVEADSPAGRAGLRGLKLKPGVTKPQSPGDVILGDVIVGFNGRPVEGNAQLFDLVELTPADQDVDLEVRREGKRMKLVLKLQKAGAVSL